MPRYDYVCPSCGHEIVNVKQSLAEHGEPMKCPKCGTVMEQHFDTMKRLDYQDRRRRGEEEMKIIGIVLLLFSGCGLVFLIWGGTIGSRGNWFKDE